MPTNDQFINAATTMQTPVGRSAPSTWPPARLHYGGDYNPEQWPAATWDEDVRLMQRAGVTLATVGVFSWSKLEPQPGKYCFDWLDDVLERLTRGGVEVLLATATASPPPWFTRLHPHSLPVTADGLQLSQGSRQHYSPSSRAYREHAMRLVEALASRYGNHPALVAWHVNNEYGCHVSRSYDDESAAAFREWLHRRYVTVDRLNEAWGTTFWSQEYSSFDQIVPPRATPAFINPTQSLDFDRFSSDALLDLYKAEAAILRRISPEVPITTNFMGFFKNIDYWSWAPHLDIISDDAYPDPADSEAYVGLAAQRDLMRSLGEGRPWILMESATDAVQWRPLNLPKAPGQHRAQSLQAAARGADAVMHFQWRQSVAGAEKFHSAMLPHAGPDSRVFRDVCDLGAELRDLSSALVGARVSAQVAILLDWDSYRAVEQEATPARWSYYEHLIQWYRPFLNHGIAIDFRPVGADLTSYPITIAPLLHAVSDAALERLDEYIRAGGHLVVGCHSAVLNEDLHARGGGYLGPLQTSLGIRVEEFAPLSRNSFGSPERTRFNGILRGWGMQWQDVLKVDEAEVLAVFEDGFAAGRAAITRRRHGAGRATYLATVPDPFTFDYLVGGWAADADVERQFARVARDVEVVRRGTTTVVINHSPHEREAPLVTGSVRLPPFGALVLRSGG